MGVNNELVKVQHSLVAGKYNGILLFPSDWVRNDMLNMEIPSEADLFAAAATQKYPIGTQLRKNGNLFRYSGAGEVMAVGTEGFLKCNRLIVPGKAGNSVHSGFEGGVSVAIAVNDTSFTIADTAAYKNEYENAVLVIYDYTNTAASHWLDRYTILGNDASNGTTTKLYIAPPGFQRAISTSGVTFDIYLNPYYSVGSLLTAGNQSWKSAIGMGSFAPITSGYFFWLQTAGLIHGTLSSTECGKTAYYRDVYSNTDGSLIHYTAGYQRIGYLPFGTASDYGDQTVMLQLDQ